MKKIAIGVVGLLLVAMLALFFWARAILGTEAVRAALASQIFQALDARTRADECCGSCRARLD